jgi:diacylglycerol kinase family enzyme
VRVTLIHNPGAGSQGEEDAQKLVALLGEEGHQVRLQSAKDDDWAQALEAPADVVAVAGGDGTVARVTKAMVGRGIPLAPLPAGTANNISRTLGLVGRHWEELVRGWKTARRMKLDVGVALGPWGKRYFVEGVGAGLFASLLSSNDPRRKLAALKQPDERVAHALEMLKKRAAEEPAIDLRATLDGKDVSGRYLLFEAMNIPYVGPNLFLAPDSKPGDGTLDLVLVTEKERDRLVSYLSSWQENRERLAVLPSHSGKHLRIDWDGFDLHMDDELWPDGERGRRKESGVIDLRIEGHAVEFLVPVKNNQ